MDKLLKFLQKIDKSLRSRIEKAALDIAAGKTENLNVQPIKGQKDCYRCRVGNVRILFLKYGGRNVIYDVDFRGRVYKKRR